MFHGEDINNDWQTVYQESRSDSESCLAEGLITEDEFEKYGKQLVASVRALISNPADKSRVRGITFAWMLFEKLREQHCGPLACPYEELKKSFEASMEKNVRHSKARASSNGTCSEVEALVRESAIRWIADEIERPESWAPVYSQAEDSVLPRLRFHRDQLEKISHYKWHSRYGRARDPLRDLRTQVKATIAAIDHRTNVQLSEEHHDSA